MAWMPVAEAAARLGVSERTIWRRIKSDSIPSRSEHGRTLVTLDDVQRESGDALSGAALGGSGLDDEALSGAIDGLRASKALCEREAARARTSRWMSAAVAAVLALVLLVNIWRHGAAMDCLRGEHAQALANAQQEKQDALGDLQAQLARVEAASAAQADDLARLRGGAHAGRDEVLALASARDDLQCLVEERLDVLAMSLDNYLYEGIAADAERDQLAGTVTELRGTVAQQQSAHQAVLTQQERIIATLRRHAARSTGLAEGYRLHIDIQQQALARARAELDELQTVLAQAPGAADALKDLAVRRSLRESVLAGGPSDALATANRSAEVAAPFDGLNHFMSGIRRWIASWLIRGGPDEGDATLARVD